MHIESLESRRLLAGVTLLAHGYNGNVTGWVAAAADAIEERVGDDDVSVYTLRVQASNGQLAVTGFAADSGEADFRTTRAGELVVKLDWSSVSNGAYTTQAVARVVTDYFLSEQGDVPALATLPLHLVGHSRGASLVTAMSRQLGEVGVWVDQVTSLDPHPVDGVDDYFGVSFGDERMATYDNVTFADDYWRTDGNPNNTDFDGESVQGTYQGNLNSTVQQNFFVSAHGAVPAYYVGTIDEDTGDGGDHPVLSAWYGGANPDKDETGYVFSRLGGVARPASGTANRFGGNGERTETDLEGRAWANVGNLTALDRSVARGQPLQTRFALEDRDGGAYVSVYLDTDTNPYNGISAVGGKNFGGASFGNRRIDVPTNAVAPGTYYLAARAVDTDGRSRWTYSPTRITVTEPEFAVVADGKLTITGTDGADKIRLYQTDTAFVVSLNGLTQTIPASQVTRPIEIYAGTGNDAVDGTGTRAGFYALGGPGLDTMVGGDGNDTLSGGAQSNYLIGGLGDDALNGSPGNDLMEGNGGYDRLYSNGGLDTMSGGANPDRFFITGQAAYVVGGGGNDKIYGGPGNDTLVGGQGADILSGGDGTDTADDDPLDLRTSIEILL
jgi:Ca2+-binding RTX toxin-like protein